MLRWPLVLHLCSFLWVFFWNFLKKSWYSRKNHVLKHYANILAPVITKLFQQSKEIDASPQECFVFFRKGHRINTSNYLSPVLHLYYKLSEQIVFSSIMKHWKFLQPQQKPIWISTRTYLWSIWYSAIPWPLNKIFFLYGTHSNVQNYIKNCATGRILQTVVIDDYTSHRFFFSTHSASLLFVSCVC